MSVCVCVRARSRRGWCQTKLHKLVTAMRLSAHFVTALLPVPSKKKSAHQRKATIKCRAIMNRHSGFRSSRSYDVFSRFELGLESNWGVEPYSEIFKLKALFLFPFYLRMTRITLVTYLPFSPYLIFSLSGTLL